MLNEFTELYQEQAKRGREYQYLVDATKEAVCITSCLHVY